MPPAGGPVFLLMSPPWRTPTFPSLALATLSQRVQQAGMACRTLHGSLLFARTPTDVNFLEQNAPFLFVPALYPEVDPEAAAAALLAHVADTHDKYGMSSGEAREQVEALIGSTEVRVGLRADVARARDCVESCIEAALAPDIDIVGMSVTFDSQMVAAVAIARGLKARRPDLRVIMGGAACFEEQADGVIASFDVIDAVCHSEGEAVIVELIDALRRGRPLDSVHGVAFRGPRGEVVHTPSPPLLVDLDTLPIPDYGPYIEELSRSPWADHGYKIFFETSRGCWWGQKHLCTFCGLNAEGLGFRRKSPERAYQEIVSLRRAYPDANLMQATDNILDMGYFKSVMPRLAETDWGPAGPPKLFFETKSNLRREQVGLLAAAGVVSVQPGIESFSDGVLELMDKGSTGLGQVQFLKWAYEHGVHIVYNLLYANPGEKAEWYEECARLVPYISHLPPPTGVAPVQVHRFSPYFMRPERHSLENVRPAAHYRRLHPDPSVDLARLAYVFDFDCKLLDDPELKAAHRALLDLIEVWIADWKVDRCFLVEGVGRDAICDRRVTDRMHLTTGLGRELLEFLDSTRTLRAATRRFGELDPDVLRAAADLWQARRWVTTDGAGRHLCVLPRMEYRNVASTVQQML